MDKESRIVMFVFFGIGIVFTVIAIAVDSIVAKCIWFFLAAAVFGFTIYATVDAIIKSRRHSKKIENFMMDLLMEADNDPEFIASIEQQVVFDSVKRNTLFESQRPDDEDYGYSLSNPIMTKSITYSELYLKSLRTLDGKSFTWTRNSSHYVPKISGIKDVMVDEYQLYLNGEKYGVIYMCPHGRSASYTPRGLTLSKE